MKINSILNDYRNGDFDTRLSLFLNFRDLRDEFMEIDEADFNRQRTEPVKKKSALEKNFTLSEAACLFTGNLFRKVSTAFKAI